MIVIKILGAIYAISFALLFILTHIVHDINIRHKFSTDTWLTLSDLKIFIKATKKHDHENYRFLRRLIRSVIIIQISAIIILILVCIIW
jgi:hypothetical protein